MGKTIKLCFRTEGNGTATITVPDAPEIKPAGSLVKAAMDKILETGIVLSRTGLLTAAKSASYMSADRTVFDFSP
jgi:hypothetical protein